MCEARQIELYIQDQLPQEEMLLLEARLLIDQDLSEKVVFQKKTYNIIKVLSRKKLKEEIESVHFKMFNETRYRKFQQRIISIFNK